MSKQIPLSQEKFAIVDDADYEWLNQWKWFVKQHHRTWYAVRNVWHPKHTIVRMHRVIVGSMANDLEIDHCDGNGLNNIRANLRVCTRLENGRNVRISKRNTSGYKGVSWHNGAHKWRASITAHGSFIHLGYFSDPSEAAQAYDRAAQTYHGKFARVNFPEAIKAG